MEHLCLPPESYLAGLWQEALPQCLLWHLHKPPERGAVRDLEAGPSWSWASVISEGRLTHGGSNMWALNNPHPLFRNLQPTIVPTNGDHFGQLDTATLRLQVSIFPIEREWRDSAPHMRLCGEKKWYPEAYSPLGIEPKDFKEKLQTIITDAAYRLGILSKEQYFEYKDKITIRSYAHLRWDTTDMLRLDGTSSRTRRLYMVPIAWGSDKDSSKVTNPRKCPIRGLILQRLPNRGQYVRVGVFMTECYGSHQNTELAEAIIQRIPRKAIARFSERYITQSRTRLWMRSLGATDNLLSDIRRGWSRKVATSIGPDDHLGTDAEGLYIIDIL